MIISKPKNLVDKEFKDVLEKWANGEETEGRRAVKRVYKHPIKKRTVLISNGQYNGVRR